MCKSKILGLGLVLWTGSVGAQTDPLTWEIRAALNSPKILGYTAQFVEWSPIEGQLDLWLPSHSWIRTGGSLSYGRGKGTAAAKSQATFQQARASGCIALRPGWNLQSGPCLQFWTLKGSSTDTLLLSSAESDFGVAWSTSQYWVLPNSFVTLGWRLDLGLALTRPQSTPWITPGVWMGYPLGIKF